MSHRDLVTEGDASGNPLERKWGRDLLSNSRCGPILLWSHAVVSDLRKAILPCFAVYLLKKLNDREISELDSHHDRG